MDSKRNNRQYSSSDDEIAALKMQIKKNGIRGREERKRLNRLNRLGKKAMRLTFQKAMNPSLHDDDDYVPLQRIIPSLNSRILVCQWGKKEKRQRHNLTIRRAKTASGWEVERASFANFRSVRFDTKDKRFPDGVWKVKCRIYETTLFQSSFGNGARYQSEQLEKESAEKLAKEEKKVQRLCDKAFKISEALGVDLSGVDVDEDELESFMAEVGDEVHQDLVSSLNDPSVKW